MDASENKGFGEQLYQRLQGKGLSKGQIYKVLALQRLNEEVTELMAKGLLAEGQALEISKITSAARQKQLAELTVEKNLPINFVKELSKLIRTAEKTGTDKEATKYWDFFFEVKEMLDQEGPTKDLLKLIKNFGVEKPFTVTGTVEVAEGTAGGRVDRNIVSFGKLDLELGRGLDVGTVNICSAARQRDGQAVFNIQRNAFLDVRSDTFTKKMLMKLGIDYIVQGDKGYVIGDPAFELANIFEKNTRRPMKDGMISPVEREALLIVSLLVAELLGHPQSVGEVCAFSVPADPIDADRNVIYHRGALEAVLRKLGYSPKPMLEGHSVVFSELAQQDYTGIGISCGGGMFNVCIAYKSVPALTFSTSRGGDWIDNNVSSALGMPIPQVCAIKESGVNLLKPRDRVEDAVVIYYRNLIQYTLETIKVRLETAQNMPTFTKPIDLVCAGGTSLIQGFIDVFREEFEKVQFPLDVREIRLARDPLRAIAEGCLQGALEETKALKDITPNLEPSIGRAEVSKTTQIESETKRRILGQGGSAPRPDNVKITHMDVPKAPTGTPLAPRADSEKVVHMDLPKRASEEPVAPRADSEKVVHMEVPKAPTSQAAPRADSEKVIHMEVPKPAAKSDTGIRRAEPSKVETSRRETGTRRKPTAVHVEELPPMEMKSDAPVMPRAEPTKVETAKPAPSPAPVSTPAIQRAEPTKIELAPSKPAPALEEVEEIETIEPPKPEAPQHAPPKPAVKPAGKHVEEFEELEELESIEPPAPAPKPEKKPANDEPEDLPLIS